MRIVGVRAVEGSVARALSAILPEDSPIRVETFVGGFGPRETATVVRINSAAAIANILSAPGQLGLARAYIAGEVDVEGDITRLMDVKLDLAPLLKHPSWMVGAFREIGFRHLLSRRRAYPEARLSGRKHSLRRDRRAVDYHYEAPTPFFELLLGPSMAYTCAVFTDESQDLTAAQVQKYDLVCRKLRLGTSSRLLDVGSGWGGFAMHAAETTGCRVVAVTLGTRQADYARSKIRERGLSDLVAIRQMDYRDVTDGPYDCVAAIGAFEHIGLPSRGANFFDRVMGLLRPGGRFLNQAIASNEVGRMATKRRGFVENYVFPDGELHEIGRTISAIQGAGLEVRHAVNLREHYILTAERWRKRLEDDWPAAIEAGGEARARIWRLFLAGYGRGLAQGQIAIWQTLSVKPHNGRSNFALREDYEREPALAFLAGG